MKRWRRIPFSPPLPPGFVSAYLVSRRRICGRQARWNLSAHEQGHEGGDPFEKERRQREQRKRPDWRKKDVQIGRRSRARNEGARNLEHDGCRDEGRRDGQADANPRGDVGSRTGSTAFE